MSFKQLTKSDAIEVVNKIINQETTLFHLVPFEKYQYGKNLRSERYKYFNVLCHINCHKNAGWLVCKYVTNNGCPTTSALLTFNNTNSGTGRLERHAKSHATENKSKLSIVRNLPQRSTKELARAAAIAVALDLRPISFTDNKKGMQAFVEAIFKSGQATPIGDLISPKSLLPSARSVSDALKTLFIEVVETFKKSQVPLLLESGGALTTDGVTISVQDRQFYDLTVHNLTFCQSPDVSKRVEASLQCRTIMLREKPDHGDAISIRRLIFETLIARYGIDLDANANRFTFVTDCAAVMAKVAGSSVSKRNHPMAQKWMGCVAHQINTAMKSCIASLGENEDLSKIVHDLNRVKTVVRIFKQSGLNGKLPSGYHLIAECETRFSTVYSVAKRFLKSAHLVREKVQTRESTNATEALSLIETELDEDGVIVGYPAVEAIVDAFEIVADVQQVLKGGTKPTIHLALPYLQGCYDELDRIAGGGTVYREQPRGSIPPSRYTRKLCQRLIDWLQAKVQVHDLWLVACFLHPFLREFQFIPAVETRRDYKKRAEKMSRSLISDLTNNDNNDMDSNRKTNEENDGVEKEKRGNDDALFVRTRPFGKRSFDMMQFADSHFVSCESSDEVARYIALDVPTLGLEKEQFMSDAFAASRFWYMHKSSFPNLFKVARRVYATPVTSCSSERVFSAVNRIVTRDRASLSPEKLEQMIMVRSMM